MFFSSQLGKLRHGEVSSSSKVMEAQEHRGLSFMESSQVALSGNTYLEGISKN